MDLIGILYGLAAYLVWFISAALFAFATAIVAHLLGVGVQQVNIGMPCVFERLCRYWQLRIGLFPIGGTVVFCRGNDPNNDEDELEFALAEYTVLYRDAGASRKFAILLSGSLTVFLAGIFSMGLPIWIGTNQLASVSPNQSQVHPCGVSGLAVSHEPATWSGQLQLARDTVGEGIFRMIAFQSLEGWGGFIAMFVTFGAVGTQLSFWDWCSLAGVVLFGVGTLNLLPIPINAGYWIVLTMGEAVVGKRVPERIQIGAAYFYLVLMVWLFIRLCWADGAWLWALFVA